MTVKPTLIIITGPTAVGKTAISIQLAKHFNTEIISCDSRQIYNEMSIGTAKPSIHELQQVKHHFIDHVSIHQKYTTNDFQREAYAVIESLFQEKKQLILTGGTGLYIKALIEGLDDFPEVPESVFQQLNKDWEQKGIEHLQSQLKLKDPIYYEQVDLQNSRRLIRALAVIEASGKAFSSFLNQRNRILPFNYSYFVLNRPRHELYKRINLRVDQMIEQGLLDEARELMPYENLSALQTVGYRELFPYFKNECDLEFAISKIKQHTRNYAKRQLTWFRKVEEAIWIDHASNTFDQIIKHLNT